MIDLEEQLQQAKDQREQYKAISEGLQKTVDEHGNVRVLFLYCKFRNNCDVFI